MQNMVSGTLNAVQILSAVLVFLFGLALLAIAVMFVVDRTQTKSAVRRNFPVIGRFRYAFEHLGEYCHGSRGDAL
jgi:hypothetical protein